MQTYWNVEVQTWRDGKRGTSVSTGAMVLENALSLAVKEASYYRLTCGYEDVTIELTEAYERCHNNGTINVAHPRSVRVVRCPECRGHIPTGHIPRFAFVLHENSVADLHLTGPLV